MNINCVQDGLTLPDVKVGSPILTENILKPIPVEVTGNRRQLIKNVPFLISALTDSVSRPGELKEGCL